MEDKRILAKNLKHFRFSVNLSQEQLAEKSGLSRNYISDIENSRSNPTLETLTDIAIALNINTYSLLKPIDQKTNSYKRIDIYRKNNQ